MAFRSSQSAQTASSVASITVTAPAGIADDDILVGSVTCDSSIVTYTPPTGFGDVGDGRVANTGDAAASQVFWKRAASESGNYQFTLSGTSTECVAFVAAYSGRVTSGSPIDGHNFLDDDTGGSSPRSFPVNAITTTVDGADIIYIGFTDGFSSGSWTWAPPTSPGTFTEREDVTNASWCSGTLADYVQTTAGSTGTVTGVATGGSNAGGAAFLFALQPVPSSATITQAAFAFGDDDGTESGHTLGTENSNFTGPANTAKTLRIQLNTSGDPAAKTFRLKYQKDGTGGYSTIPVGSGTSPTISTPTVGTLAYSSSGGASVAPSYPASIAADDTLVLIVGQKPSSANGGTCTTPSGWTLQAQRTGATDGDTGGYTTTLGADTGNTNIYVYTKDSVTGSESGTLSVTVGTNGVCWGAIVLIPKTDTGTWSITADTGKDTAAGNVSIASSAGMDVAAGDMMIGAMVIPTDVTTPSQFSAEAMSQTGSTFGTMGELAEPDSTTGNDIGGFIFYQPVSSGSGSGVVTMSATAGGTTTNVRGPGIILRARVTGVSNDVYVDASSNISASGADSTTNRLSTSGGTFQAGARIDDSATAPSLDFTSGYQSEWEWKINTKSGLADSTYFEFRLYDSDAALDTYTYTPKWTIGTAGGQIYTRTLTDSASVADNPIRYAKDYRAMSEPLAIIDALSKSQSFGRVASDALTIFDLLFRGLSYGRVTTEQITVTETMIRSMIASRIPSDAITVSEAMRQKADIFRQLLDTTSLSDSLASTVSVATSVIVRMLSDYASVEDIAARTVKAYRGTIDAAGIYDAAIRTARLYRNATDGLDASDRWLATVRAFRMIPEQIAVTDEVKRSAKLIRSIIDSTAVTDILIVELTLAGVTIISRVLADNIGLQDRISRAANLFRKSIDASDVSDVGERYLSAMRLTADTLIVAESAARFLLISRIATDTIQASDMAFRYALINRLLQDSAEPSDRIVETFTYFQQILGFVLSTLAPEPIVMSLSEGARIKTVSDMQYIETDFSEGTKIETISEAPYIDSDVKEVE